MKPEWISEELWIELLAQRARTREFYERGRTMTNDNGQEMTAQAVAIVESIDLGNIRMTLDRWAEEIEKSAQFEGVRMNAWRPTWDLATIPLAALKSEWAKRCVALRKNPGRNGARPQVPTACPKCGEMCPGSRIARSHCRSKIS